MAKSQRGGEHIEEALRDARGDQDDRGHDPQGTPMVASDMVDWENYFQEPVNLPAPEARPGYVNRWIRVGLHGEDDPANYSKSLRKGWKPLRTDSVAPEFAPMVQKHGEHAGVISAHGMILCERPKPIDDMEKEFLRRRTRQQTQAITRDLEQIEDPKSMPVSIEMRSEIRRGGRIPRVQPPDSDVQP